MLQRGHLLDVTAVSGSITVAVATPGYSDPVLSRGQRRTLASDMYSLGITFSEILCGKVPKTVSPVDVDAHIRNVSAHIRDPEADSCYAQYTLYICLHISTHSSFDYCYRWCALWTRKTAARRRTASLAVTFSSAYSVQLRYLPRELQRLPGCAVRPTTASHFLCKDDFEYHVSHT